MTASVMSVAPASLAGDVDHSSATAVNDALAAAAEVVTDVPADIVTFDGVPEGLTPLEWATIQSQIAAHEAGSAVAAVPPAAAATAPLTAPIDRGIPSLATDRFDALFTPGAAVIAASSAAPVILSTNSIGVFETTSPGAISDGTVVEYAHHPSLTEWFFEVDRGIEHGFTILAPVAVTPTFEITVEVLDATPSLLDPNTVLLERADEASLYYRDLVAFDADLRALPSSMDVVDGSIVLSIDAAGAVYPITVDPVITEDQTLDPIADASFDGLGDAMAMHGIGGITTLAVSARDAEVVYVFEDRGAGWVQQTVIAAPVANSGFGSSVDVHENRIAIGAEFDNNGNGTNAGAVYVYEQAPTTPFGWSLQTTVFDCDPTGGACGATASGGQSFANFGSGVDLADGVLVVGARGSDRAYVYETSGSDYLTSTGLEIVPPRTLVSFGSIVSVSDSGTHILVGAPVADRVVPALVNAGSAVYTQYTSGSPGSLSTPYEVRSGTIDNAELGSAVAVESDIDGDASLFIGEPGTDRVWQYVIAAGNAPPPTDPLSFRGSPGGSVPGPHSVDFSGTHVVQGDTAANGTGGTLWSVVDSATDNYNSIVTHTPASAQPGDLWGFQVVAFGDSWALAGPGSDVLGQNSGEIRIRSFSNSIFDVAFTSTGDSDGDRFGHSVSIDGDRMAVAALQDDDAAADAGRVHMYERTGPGAPWTADGVIVAPVGSAFANGEFGFGLDLLGDRVVIGNPDITGTGGSPGEAYVFERTGAATWTQLGNTLSGSSAGDRYGAGVAWKDLNNFVVSSPLSDNIAADAGELWEATFGVSWTTSSISTPLVAAGDQLGFSVAVSQDSSGLFVLGAGVPGDDLAGADAGGLHVYQDTGSGFTHVQEFNAPWATGDRVGTAVASDRGHLSVAGIGDQGVGAPLQIHLIVRLGATTYLIEDTATSTLGAAVGAFDTNSYLSMVGRNVIVGRPGAGGQAALFRDVDGTGFNDSDGVGPSPGVPVDQLIPTGTVVGDGVGFSIEFDGNSAVVGAPGAAAGADTGKAVSFNAVPLTHVFTGAVDSAWSDPANWDTGLVPGPTDTAIVPVGADVDTQEEVDRLIIGAGATVDVNLGGRIVINGPAAIEGVLNVFSTAVGPPEDGVSFNDDVTLNGTIIIDSAAPASVFLDAPVTFDGTGTIQNNGILVADTAGSSIGASLSYNTASTSILGVTGDFTIGPDVSEAGRVVVSPGAILTYSGNVSYPGGVLELVIDGDSTTTANHGRVDIAGSSFLNFGRVDVTLDTYTPTAADDYLLVQCAPPGRCDLIGLVASAPLEVTVDEFSIRAALPEVVPNKLIATDGHQRFGTAVDVDGDWAIVSQPGFPGPVWTRFRVLERSPGTGDWTIAQTIEIQNLVLASHPTHGVAIEGNVFAAIANGGDLVVYERPSEGSPFVLNSTIAGPYRSVAMLGSEIIAGRAGTADTLFSNGSNWVVDQTVGPSVPDPDFGFAVAIDGDIAVVTANDDVTITPGAVHVFERIEGTWSTATTLTNPDAATTGDGWFGSAVDLEGLTLLVGHAFEDNDNALSPDSGAAWVYEGSSASSWGTPEKLVASDANTSNGLGIDVELSGGIALIGAAGAQETGVSTRNGAAYAFDNVAGTWTQDETFRAADGAGGDQFGHAVGLSDENVLVGSRRDDNINNVDAGSVYWYSASAPVSTPVFPSGAISGDWAAIGVPDDDVVYIMRNIAGTWTDVQTIAGTASTQFGAAVAMDMPGLTIGAPGADEVQHFRRDATGQFVLRATRNGDPNSRYGSSVGISYPFAIVGAPLADANGVDSGSIHTYRFSFPQEERVDGFAAGDQFGFSVSRSVSDWWIGAPYADSSGFTDNGNVYRYRTITGVPSNTIEASAPQNNGLFGWAVDGDDLRAAIKLGGSVGITIWDQTTGQTTLAGISTGFGQELVLAGDLLSLNDQGIGQGESFSDNGNDGVFASVDVSSGQYVDVASDGGTVLWVLEATGPVTAGTDLATFVIPDQSPPSGKVLPEFGGSYNRFGQNVDVDGDTMVVVARAREVVANEIGSLYVFERVLGEWTLSQRIDDGTFSLRSVSIEGDVIAAGRVGSVRVFERPGFGSPFAELTTVTGVPSDVMDLDIEADSLVVGAFNGGAGQVDVYDGGAASWATDTPQTISANAPKTASDDLFGGSVHLEGNVLAVGAPGTLGASGQSGYVDVLTRPDALSPFVFDRTLDEAEVNDDFGTEVAISDGWIIVGADGASSNVGAVYVYDEASGAVPTATLETGATPLNQRFGVQLDADAGVLVASTFRGDNHSFSLLTNPPTPLQVDTVSDQEEPFVNDNDGYLAVSAGTLAVGHNFEDQQGENSGAVYAIELPDPVAPVPGRIEAPDAAAGDFFGQDIDIHDNWMVVGARNGNGGEGSAYVFERDLFTEEWTFVTEISSPSPVMGEWFGVSVAISGTRQEADGDAGNMVVAVGAPDPFGATMGTVHLFRYDFILDDWVLSESIPAPVGYESFGFSVDVEQTTSAFRNGTYLVAVGAPSITGGTGDAAVYRYTVTENPSFGDSLVTIGEALAPADNSGNQHGWSVAIDGDTVVVSERGADFGPTADVGQAHVYRVESSAVEFEATLVQPGSDQDASDLHGHSVAVDGDLAVVTAFFDGSAGAASGAAYVYTRTGTTWSDGEALSSITGPGDNFGTKARVEDGQVIVSSFAGGSNGAGLVQGFSFDVSDGWVGGDVFEWEAGVPGDGMGSGIALGEDGTVMVGTAEDDTSAGVDAGGVHEYSTVVDSAPGKLVANDAGIGRAGDGSLFGGSVDIDGEWMIVGATEDFAASEPGNAYMFRRIAGEWVLFDEFGDDIPSGPNFDFGIEVAVGGDWAAVTEQDNSTWIFNFDGISWTLVNDISFTGANRALDVDIDGVNDRLIASDPILGVGVGNVHIYDLIVSGSHVEHTVNLPGDIADAWFGQFVAIDGDVAMATASRDQGTPGVVNTGTVRVFERSGTTWNQTQTLESGVGGQLFGGGGVELSGSTALIGEPGGNAAWVYTFDGLEWGPEQELTVLGEPFADQLGTTVDLDGDLAVIASPRASVDGMFAGEAHVFERTGSTWTVQQSITASDREMGDSFAAAVGLSGTDLAVGAPFDHNNEGIFAGGVYTFELVAPLVAGKIISPDDADIRFGHDIDIDGDRAIVGALGDPSVPGDFGAAWVLTRDGLTNGWTVLQELVPSTPVLDDRFGASVAISGSRIAVRTITKIVIFEEVTVDVWTEVGTINTPSEGGALDLEGNTLFAGRLGQPSGGFADAGIVEVWTGSGATWSLDQTLEPSVPRTEGWFGGSIDVDGGRVLIGSPGREGVGDPGEAYIFELASIWDEIDRLVVTPPATRSVGAAVALDGDLAVVGAGRDGDLTATGVVHVFEAPATGTDWTQVAQILDPAGVNGDSFGQSVDIVGERIGVGVSGGDPGGIVGAGDLRIYDRTAPDAWTLVSTLAASDGVGSDFLGESIALAPDSILGGAPFEDNTNGNNAGSVYFFDTPDVLIPDDPSLTFTLGLQPGAQPSVIGGGTGIAVSELTDAATVIEDNAGNTTSVGSTGLQEAGVAESPFGAIRLDATPFGAIAANDPVLSALPLLSVGLDQPGGWAAILDSDPAGEYDDLPLVNITLGDVFSDPDLAGAVGAIPFGAIDVNGTPFGAIPFGAIALGGIPISDIPLDADRLAPAEIAEDWCAILADSDRPCGAGNTLDPTATVMSVGLSDVPFGAIPFGAIPFGAIDVDEAPFGAINLSELGIASTPFGAIPFGAIELAGTPFGAIPFGAIDFESIPFGAIPFGAIDIDGIAFEQVPFGAIPFGAIDVNGAPFGAIPFGAIVLGETSLDQIPLDADRTGPAEIEADWCSLMAEYGLDCTGATPVGSTTVVDLGVRGVPFGAIPFGAIDYTSIPFGAIPFGAIGVEELPFGAIPFGAIPFGAIDLTGTPFGAISTDGTVGGIPFGAIDVQGSPFGAIEVDHVAVGPNPFGAIPFGAIGLEELPFGAIPFGAIDVNGLPFGAIPFGAITVDQIPFGAIDLAESPFGAIELIDLPFGAIGNIVDCSLVDCETATLRDAFLAGAILPGAVLADLGAASDDFRLPDLAEHLTTNTAQDLYGAVAAWAIANSITIADLTNFANLTLGDLPVDHPLFAQTLLGDLGDGLDTVTWLDLALAVDVAGDPVVDLEVILDAHAVTNGLTLADFESFGDVTFSELLPALTLSGGQLGDLGVFLAFIRLNEIGNLTQGDVTAALSNVNGNGPWLVSDAVNDPDLGLGNMLLADLLGSPDWGAATVADLVNALPADELAGFTLGDLLLGLLPPGALPWGVAFENIDAADIPGVMPPIGMQAQFALTGTRTRTITVAVELPAGAGYVPGSAVVTAPLGGDLEPELVDGRLVWTFTGVEPGVDDQTPGQTYNLDFDIQPSVSVGASLVNSDARIVGTTAVVESSAILEVVEAFEPNDTPPGIPAAEDTVYLVNISTDTDIDLFHVDIGDGDSIAVNLSGLPADFDIVLYSDLGAPVSSTALSQTSDADPIVPVLDPDADQSEAVPDQGFRRLDQEFDDLALVEVSNSRSLDEETIIAERLPAGRYIIQVHGHDGVTSPDPAVLQIQVEGAEAVPACVARGALPAAAAGVAPNFATLPADLNTVILVNEQRFEQIYGAGGRSLVTNSLNDLVTAMDSDPEISQMGLSGVVVPVDGFADVRAAYAALDNPANAEDACDPNTTNAIVSEIISDVLDPIRALRDIENIVLIGSDDLLPMARLADATEVANEFDYRFDLTGRNAFTSSFWASTFLSDDPYGETAALPFGDRFIYLPDAALGRVLEEPQQIKDYIDQFILFDGILAAETGLVAGYDFLIDGSEAIADELTGPIAPADLDRDLEDGIDDLNGDGAWTATDIGDRLLTPDGAGDANGPDIVSFNAHFDHYRALPAAGDQVPGFNDNFEVSEIDALPAADGLLDGSIIFSMGCHSGLNVPNTSTGLTGVLDDWAEAFIDQQAVYVGNTGFGYGDTETVGYTERLLQLFARNLVNPINVDALDPNDITTIGQAMQFAKQEAYSELVDVSVYHEKAIQESTLYGLPFFRVGVPAQPAPEAPDNEPFIDPLTGEGAVVFMADADNIPNPVGTELYYSNLNDAGDPSTITQPGRPIQPSLTLDVTDVLALDTTQIETEARGAIILDMTSSYVGIDPVVAVPVFDESSQAPEPDLDNINYPTVPQRISTFEKPEGQRQNLVLATGQYRGTEDAGVQRLDDDIDVIVYYSNDADRSAPAILRVDSVLDGAQLTITAEVDDHGGSGVDRVYVLATPSAGDVTAEWFGIDLIESPPASGRWVGAVTFPTVPTNMEFLVQAKDNAGNVGVSTNKAENFSDEVAPPPPVSLTTAVTASVGGDPINGFYTGPVTVTADADGLPIQFSLDGAPLEELTPAGVAVAGDGIHTVEFVVADGQTAIEIVTIDTLAPAVTLIQPQVGSVYAQGQEVAAIFSCQDPAGASCSAVVGGLTLESGDLLPTTSVGAFTITVTGTDALGNVASAVGSYEVVGGLGFLVDQINDLIANEPDNKIRKELEKTLENVNKAVVHLEKTPIEISQAIKDLKKAAKEVDDALDKGLPQAVGDDLLNTLGNLGRNLAFEAINTAMTRGGDPDDIDEAIEHFQEGVILLATDVEDALDEFEDAAKDAEKA
ncbi:MAG: hypothetical protein ACR2P0_15985 [Acidimicrobiales bacterium]